MNIKSEETRDVCQFCATMWGVDKSNSCHSTCTCAIYINQDYVPQRELTIGLPCPRAWDNNKDSTKQANLVPKGPHKAWKPISQEEIDKMREAYPSLLIKLHNAPSLCQMLSMLMTGADMKFICKALKIKKRVYYEYAKRLRATANL